MTTSAERRSLALLTGIAEPGNLVLGALVRAYGPIDALAVIRGEAMLQSLSDFLGRRLSDTYVSSEIGNFQVRLTTVDPDAALETANSCGGRLVCPDDDEWPTRLGDLSRAEPPGLLGGGEPLALWVRGAYDLAEFAEFSCGVVGSRAPTDYGRFVASELSSELADRDVTVVSGAALGIDAAAHRGALAVNGRTIAILACGIDRAYPSAHTALLERIGTEGLIVSEVPPGSGPNRPRFLVRNRLIAALGVGTVIVEAALRSGALNTAGWVTGCRHQLMGVPGPITSDRSAGVHGLIRANEAVLVASAEEVLELIGPSGDNLLVEPRGESRSRDGLDPRMLQVLEAVPVKNGVGVARIGTAAGIAPETVIAVLGRLELLGFVEREGGGWRLSASERKQRRHAAAG